MATRRRELRTSAWHGQRRSCGAEVTEQKLRQDVKAQQGKSFALHTFHDATTDAPGQRLGYRTPETEWTLADLEGSLTSLEKGRSFVHGRELFRTASCVACHKLGDAGNQFGPELAKLDELGLRENTVVFFCSDNGAPARDGVADFAVFRPSSGVWYVFYSRTNTYSGFAWGTTGDKPVAGDYDGDGKTDIAVFRPSNGVWNIRQSGTGTFASFAWGVPTDVPVPADYDGDGKTDIAVYRPSNGTWYMRYSTTGGLYGFVWGSSTDVPITQP